MRYGEIWGDLGRYGEVWGDAEHAGPTFGRHAMRPTPRSCLGHVSTLTDARVADRSSRPHLGRISAASRPHLGRISATSRLHLRAVCVCIVSPPRLEPSPRSKRISRSSCRSEGGRLPHANKVGECIRADYCYCRSSTLNGGSRAGRQDVPRLVRREGVDLVLRAEEHVQRVKVLKKKSSVLSMPT